MAAPYLKVKRTHYTPGEIAKLVGVSRQTVVRWITDGRLPGVRTKGGHWRVPAEVVHDPDGTLERLHIESAG